MTGQWFREPFSDRQRHGERLTPRPHASWPLICFWSDHGWHLGEKHHWRKFALWEETTRAPHIWVVPGLTKPDSRCDRTVD